MDKSFNLEDYYSEINYVIESVLEIIPDRINLKFITLIPQGQNFPAGFLKNFDIKNFKRRISRHLSACEISFAFGVVEFCTKEYSHGKEAEVMWKPHAHLVCLIKNSQKETESILKKYYRRSKNNNGRPIDIRPVKGLYRLVNYITKNPGERGRISRSFGFGKVISRHGRLPKNHKVELEQYLIERSKLPNGAGSPIFARGVMRRGSRWFPATSKKRRW